MFRSFLFEIWADKVLLLDGQDLMSAMASYFELCFVFQLGRLGFSFLGKTKVLILFQFRVSETESDSYQYFATEGSEVR